MSPIFLPVLFFLPAGAAQQPDSQKARAEAAAVERGNQVYRPSCGFCHGIDARGAAGPGLARSLVVLNDVGGKDFWVANNPGNGRQLWHTTLEYDVSNSPITYMLDGVQYMVLAAGDAMYSFRVHN